MCSSPSTLFFYSRFQGLLSPKMVFLFFRRYDPGTLESSVYQPINSPHSAPPAPTHPKPELGVGCIFFRLLQDSFQPFKKATSHQTIVDHHEQHSTLHTRSLGSHPTCGDARSLALPIIGAVCDTRVRRLVRWPKSWMRTGARRRWQGKRDHLVSTWSVFQGSTGRL